MNQKLITTEKATILCFMLPEGAKNIRIKNGYVWYDDNHFEGCCTSALPEFDTPGNWQPLGFAKDVSEEVAKEIVKDFREMEYPDYEYPYEIVYYDEDTALEAFHSLLKANEVYLVNPYGVHPILSDNDAGSKEETETRFLRQQAQQSVGNWYILKLEK